MRWKYGSVPVTKSSLFKEQISHRKGREILIAYGNVCLRKPWKKTLKRGEEKNPQKIMN